MRMKNIARGNRCCQPIQESQQKNTDSLNGLFIKSAIFIFRYISKISLYVKKINNFIVSNFEF